jgi:hypothetical protein
MANQPDYISDLIEKGVLQTRIAGQKQIICLFTPCYFILSKEIVRLLQNKYLFDQEVGGLFWAKPEIVANSKRFDIKEISFIRNAIDEYPRKGNRTKQDAYWSDQTEYRNEFKKICEANMLPIGFHSHPCGDSLDFISIFQETMNFETSDQDLVESKLENTIYGKKMLLPRALIAKENKISRDIFIGIYDGFIAKERFQSSVKKVQKESTEKISKWLSELSLSNSQKIALGITAIALFALIVKTRKYSFPVLTSLAAAAPLFLSNTDGYKNPEYYNKTAEGPMKIYIP